MLYYNLGFRILAWPCSHQLYIMKHKWISHISKICIHQQWMPTSFKYFINHCKVFFVIPNPSPCGCKILQVFGAKPQSLFQCIAFCNAFSIPTLFWMYPFTVFMQCSIGYIHQVCTGPHIFNCSTKWTNKWVMMSKKEGGNSCSNSTNIRVASFLSSPIITESKIFAHNFLKTQNKWIMASLQPFAIKCCMHKVINLASWCDSRVISAPSIPHLFELKTSNLTQLVGVFKAKRICNFFSSSDKT